MYLANFFLLQYPLFCAARIAVYNYQLQNKKVNYSDVEPLYKLQNGLDDESFMNYKSGLMAKLLEKDPSLAYETNRFWGQIVDQRYNLLSSVININQM